MKILDNPLFRADGWINLLMGLGKRQQKVNSTYFGESPLLDDDELTRMWVGEGIGKKIVSAIADDMTRNWISIDGDEEGKIMDELDRLNAETKFNEALKWTRLYRGAVIVLGINGQKLKKPMKSDPKGIDWLKVYPAPAVRNQQTDIITDKKSPYFEDFETFKIQKLNGRQMEVHTDRILQFKGEPIPRTLKGTDLRFDYQYWGVSTLQSIWNQLTNFGAIESGIANLMMEIVIGKFKLSNLADILASNNVDAIYNRIEVINACKSILNAVLIGENEEYTRDTANLGGVADMLDRFMMLIAGVAEYPVTRLFGRSPAGMNATGESDLRNYYDKVSSEQKIKLKPPLQLLVNWINSYLKVTDDPPTIHFLPVWEPTEEERIKMKKDQMETDKGYVEMGALTAEEIRTNRFVSGYSFETTVEDEEI